jgi:hypothetical protein
VKTEKQAMDTAIAGAAIEIIKADIERKILENGLIE